MSIFKGIEKDESNACLNWRSDSLPLYISGYKKAAEKLLNLDFKELSVQEIDTLVFPIIFLYRQYIELELKYIIRETNILLNKKAEFPPHHGLLDLWDKADILYIEMTEKLCHPDYNYSTVKERNSIRDVLNEFNKIDHGSFSFRYPKDKNGNKNLSNVEYISLNNFKTEMQQLCKRLDNITLTIINQKIYKDETSS